MMRAKKDGVNQKRAVNEVASEAIERLISEPPEDYGEMMRTRRDRRRQRFDEAQ
jgi:hypothetical protein